MPTDDEIRLSQASLYDSAALRDDLNDAEATILLLWGEGQVARVAQDYPNEFEQKNRFLRQLIKGINRFVGQREFNEIEGQKEYLSKVTLYFQHLGWGHITEDAIFAALPADKKDMLGTLRAILNLLSPAPDAAPAVPPAMTSPDAAPQAMPPAMTSPDATPAVPPAMSNPNEAPLENPHPPSINQGETAPNEE